MKIPDWFQLVVLGLAAWRTFQLVAFDEILDRPRRWALRVGSEWQPGLNPQTKRPYEVPDDYRLKWGIWLTCPYCAGAWIAAIWWGAFELTPHWTMVFAILAALFCFPIAGHKLLSKEEDR